MPLAETPVATISALRSNEDTAWEAAYDELWNQGMKIALVRLSGPEHHEDRRDAVQTAISQIQQGLLNSGKSFNQITVWNDLANMMRFITHQRVTDVLRKKYRNRENVESEWTAVEFSTEAPDQPEDAWDTEALWQLVGRLKPPKAQLLFDRFVLRLSTDEIAGKYDMPRGTVTSHYRESFLKLKGWLKKL